MIILPHLNWYTAKTESWGKAELSIKKLHTFNAYKNYVKTFPIKWRGTEMREPGRIGAGDGREAGGDGAGCGSHAKAGGGRRMRDIKFFNDFLVPF